MVVAELCRSVTRARGPGTEAQRPLKRSSTKIGAQLDETCKTGQRKEKSDERMELHMRGILHAGCFLFHGLPLEYNIQSDCPVHE